jgi:hypothetical protein
MTDSSDVRIRSYLRPTATQAHAPARAEIVQSLAGRVSWLWEMATSRVDRSGPPFGACQRVTVWTWSGPTYNGDVSPRQLVPGRWSPVTPSGRYELRGRVHVRSHAQLPPPWIAPLSRLHLALDLRTAGSGTVSFDVRIRNLGTGETTTTTLALPSAADQFVEDVGVYLPTVPGPNDFAVRIERSVGTRTVDVRGAALFVRAKRSHHLAFPG